MYIFTGKKYDQLSDMDIVWICEKVLVSTLVTNVSKYYFQVTNRKPPRLLKVVPLKVLFGEELKEPKLM